MPVNPVYMFRGTTTFTPQEKIFSDTSSFYPGNGGYRVKCDSFNIKNLDGTDAIHWSFDGTSYNILFPYENLGPIQLSSDRYYVKADTNGLTPAFQVTAGLQNNWK